MDYEGGMLEDHSVVRVLLLYDMMYKLSPFSAMTGYAVEAP